MSNANEYFTIPTGGKKFNPFVATSVTFMTLGMIVGGYVADDSKELAKAKAEASKAKAEVAEIIERTAICREFGPVLHNLSVIQKEIVKNTSLKQEVKESDNFLKEVIPNTEGMIKSTLYGTWSAH